jgi:hypothetical protein
MTLRMMDKYGWWNVRGGSWCLYNLVLQIFWNGSVLNYQHPYYKINLHESNPTEIFEMDVLDVVETLILLKTVLQEPM